MRTRKTMTVRDLIKALVEFDMNAEIDVDTTFEGELLEEEGLWLEKVEKSTAESVGKQYAVLMIGKY